MRVKLKKDYNCDQCGLLVESNSEKDQLYKTKYGAIVCEECFNDQEDDRDYDFTKKQK